jgi:hypothetical protein
MTTKRDIRPALIQKIRELVREMGSTRSVARHLGVRENWVKDCHSGFATPLGENTVYAATGLRHPGCFEKVKS